tara:strand:- start:97 stop:393 length:297 start_codon:yes stop_codon:yes gene_type:complete
MVASVLVLVGIIVVIVLIAIKITTKKQEVAVKAFVALFLLLASTMTYVYLAFDVDITSFEGIVDGVNIYVTWLSNAFTNSVDLVGYAINQNWGNSTGG